MAQVPAVTCPSCGTTNVREVARTMLDLGIKRKYRCNGCDQRIVRIAETDITYTN